MARVVRLGATTLALSFLVGGCVGGGVPENPDPGTFVATLEAPAGVETEASGTARFTFDGTAVDYLVEVDSLEGANAAHIHHGASRVVIVPFHVGEEGADSAGVLLEGTFTADDVSVSSPVEFNELIYLMRRGGAYLNVHTATEPGGEIRGDITAAPDAMAG